MSFRFKGFKACVFRHIFPKASRGELLVENNERFLEQKPSKV